MREHIAGAMWLVVEAIDCKVTYITIFVGIKARMSPTLPRLAEAGDLRDDWSFTAR